MSSYTLHSHLRLLGRQMDYRAHGPTFTFKLNERTSLFSEFNGPFMLAP